MQTPMEQDLNELKDRVFNMLDLAIESIQHSIEALNSFDTSMADRIIADDKNIDLLGKEIDDTCLKIIAVRQPAATDLRFILSIIKINTDLERIADLSCSIASQVIKIKHRYHIKPLVDIPRMAELAIEMLRDVMQAITTKDSQKAKEVIARDEIIDRLNDQIYRELLTVMAENPHTIGNAISLMNVSKALERIGDHITNIAAQAVFYVEGEDVRHLNA